MPSRCKLILSITVARESAKARAAEHRELLYCIQNMTWCIISSLLQTSMVADKDQASVAVGGQAGHSSGRRDCSR